MTTDRSLRALLGGAPDHPDAPANAAFNFVQATLVSMDDPGLVVLPTHREICNFDGTSPVDILERGKTLFAIGSVPELEIQIFGHLYDRLL